MPRIVPVTSEPVGEMPPALPPQAEAEDAVEIVALYAETTVVVETAYAPERPRAAPIEHAPERPRAAPNAAPAEYARPPFARSGPIQQAREFEGDETPTTGVLPAVRPPRHERTSRDRERYVHVPGTVDVRGDVGPLIDDLHAIFERDRAVASQGNTARCGVCYYHFSLTELSYRDAGGFYICPDCERALGPTRIVMLRRQQRN